MIRLIFALGVAFNLTTAIVFLANFFKPFEREVIRHDGQGEPYLTITRHRHPASLVCAHLALGWCVALSREMHWLPRPVTTFLIAGSIPLGLLGAMIVVYARRQR